MSNGGFIPNRTKIGVRYNTLYRLYDSNDELLYVGLNCTLKGHGDGWWLEAVRVSLTHYLGRTDADMAELHALEFENPRWKNEDEQPNALYRCWDRDGRLLYVGVTVNLPARLRVHQAEAIWWAKAGEVTVEIYPNRHSALKAEQAAIESEYPHWNRAPGAFDETGSRKQVPLGPNS